LDQGPKKQNRGDRDHNGQQLAYVYFEEEPVRRSAAKLLSKAKDRGQYRQAASKQRQRN